MRAIGYVRVSTDQQATDGVSLDAQDAKIRAYCDLYGIELVGIEVDAGESASTLKRPGLARALAALDAGTVSGLVVVKLDRLTRSVRDLDALLTRYFAGSNPKALVSVAEQVNTETAAGRMVLNVLVSISQWEREVIGERTSAAMRHKQTRGEYIGGGIPFGFGVAAGELVECPEEQAILLDLRRLQARGLTLREIADELNSRGVLRRGRNWYPMAVSRALRMAA
jgi:DNA invertase Pin-like site-specific DNA recombinase